MKVALAYIWFILTSLAGTCQVVSVETPKPDTYSLPSTNFAPTHKPRQPSIPQYQRIGSTDYPGHNSNVIQQDMQNYLLRQQQQQQILEDAYITMNKTRIQYDFKDPVGQVHDRFLTAYSELRDMLQGETPLEITKAVALVEGAYDPSVSYHDLKEQVRNIARISLHVMQEKGLTKEDNLARIMALYHVMADTTTIQQPGEERSYTFYPLLYDFEDAWGKQDYTKMFVSKLLRFGTGNCSSLPRLFLMAAEELGAEAHLAFAPNHSYIKFQDHFGEWHNIELTNQMLTTDDHIMESGWVKSEAIRSGIYMTPLTKKELVAQSLNELALAHYKIFGYTPFAKACTDLALEYHTKSITAYQVKANYNLHLLQYIANQYQSKRYTSGQFNKDEKVRAIWEEMNHYNQSIDDLGFASVPEELYNEWIRAMNTEGNKQQSRTRLRQMINSVSR